MFRNPLWLFNNCISCMGVSHRELNEKFSTCTWQQSRHISCQKLPIRIDCVTSWHNLSILSNRFRVAKYTVKLHSVTILWFGLSLTATRKVPCFAATAWLPCRPRACQNKTVIAARNWPFSFRGSALSSRQSLDTVLALFRWRLTR